MEKSYKKELDREYVLFSGDHISVNSYEVQMALHGMIEGILPCRIYTIDQEQTWSCEYTGKISLLEYCRKRDFDGGELRWICRGILVNLINLQNYLMNEDQVLLGPEDIYLDLELQKVWNCYVPLFSSGVWEKIQSLSQFFLGHIDQKDTAAIQLGYGLFRYMNQERHNLEHIWELLDEKSIKNDIEDMDIPEQEVSIETKEDKVSMEEPVENTAESKNNILMKAWSSKHVILCFFPFVICFVLGVYFLWNKWYLSAPVKGLVAGLIVISAACGVICIRKWKDSIEKVNPLETKAVMDEQGSEETDSIWYDEREQSYESWRKSIDSQKPIGEEERDVIEHTGEILLENMMEEKEEKNVWGRLKQVDTGEEFLLRENPTVVGKLPDVVQLLAASPFISRIHARMWYEDGEGYIEDLNSKNGTYINGAAIKPQKPEQIPREAELAFANIRYQFTIVK